MTYVREFKGFAGIRLEADDIGSADDPSIILLHGAGQTRQVWEDVALALQQAGRHVINIDLRWHGGSEWPEDGRYDFDAYVEDLRAVLAQMRTRPVVVAATLGGWIATIALAEEAATLAAGLVLVDLPMTNDPDVMRTMAEKLRNRVVVISVRKILKTRTSSIFIDIVNFIIPLYGKFKSTSRCKWFG